VSVDNFGGLVLQRLCIVLSLLLEENLSLQDIFICWLYFLYFLSKVMDFYHCVQNSLFRTSFIIFFFKKILECSRMQIKFIGVSTHSQQIIWCQRSPPFSYENNKESFEKKFPFFFRNIDCMRNQISMNFERRLSFSSILFSTNEETNEPNIKRIWSRNFFDAPIHSSTIIVLQISKSMNTILTFYLKKLFFEARGLCLKRLI